MNAHCKSCEFPRLPAKMVNGVPTLVMVDTPTALKLRALYPKQVRHAWQLDPEMVATGICQGRLLELYHGATPTDEERAAIDAVAAA